MCSAKKISFSQLFFRDVIDYIFNFSGKLLLCFTLFVFLYVLFSVCNDSLGVFLKTQVFVNTKIGVDGDYEFLSFGNEDCDSLNKNELTSIFHLDRIGWDYGKKNPFIVMKLFEKKYISEEQKKCILSLKDANITNTYIDFSFFTQKDSSDYRDAGILVCFFGSLFSILVAITISVTLSVVVGPCLFYFEDKSFFWKFVSFSISVLSSIPPIMIGMFCISDFFWFSFIPRSSSYIAGIVLGMVIFPLLTISIKQSISMLPQHLRISSLSMGFSEFQTFVIVILPNIYKNILSSLLLSISRAVGETAPMLVVGMVVFVQEFPKSLSHPVTTIPTQIFMWSKNTSYGFKSTCSAAILFLLIILFFINKLIVRVEREI